MVEAPQIILIDGPAGAGKTTLSLKLQSELNCQVVHLDSIYNGWDDALTTTLTDRLSDLLQSFLNGSPYELPIFNWQKGEFDSYRTIHPDNALIIEGVGSGQSRIRDLLKGNIKGNSAKLYWVEVDEQIGLQRVLARDGDGIASQMKLWKEREAEHFQKERTRDFADFIITTT